MTTQTNDHDMTAYCSRFPEADHSHCPSSVECNHARVIDYAGRDALLVGAREGFAYLIQDGLAFKVPASWVSL